MHTIDQTGLEKYNTEQVEEVPQMGIFPVQLMSSSPGHSLFHTYKSSDRRKLVALSRLRWNVFKWDWIILTQLIRSALVDILKYRQHWPFPQPLPVMECFMWSLWIKNVYLGQGLQVNEQLCAVPGDQIT